MSSLRADLLAAVLADPSRANCAVYADHLIELGEPRGELINLDLALEGRLSGEQRQAYKARRAQLVAEHGARWWPWMAGTPVTRRMRRGFVEHVEMPSAHLVQFPDAFAEEPIHTLHLYGRADPRLDRCGSWLARLRLLGLSAQVVRQTRSVFLDARLDGLRELQAGVVGTWWTADLGGDWLPSLEVLQLDGGGGGDLIVGWREWKRLPELRVMRLWDLGERAMLRLAAWGPLERLEELEIGVDQATLARLCEHAAAFPALTTLGLRPHGYRPFDPSPLVTADFARLRKVVLIDRYRDLDVRQLARYEVEVVRP